MLKSDSVASKLVTIDWEYIKSDKPEDRSYFGIVKILNHEYKRFKLSRASYQNDDCAPCQSTAKKLRDEVAKVIREEYGE